MTSNTLFFNRIPKTGSVSVVLSTNSVLSSDDIPDLDLMNDNNLRLVDIDQSQWDDLDGIPDEDLLFVMTKLPFREVITQKEKESLDLIIQRDPELEEQIMTSQAYRDAAVRQRMESI